MAAVTYRLSVETTSGRSFRPRKAALGLDLNLAREKAEAVYHSRRAAGLPVVTVAVMMAGRVVDCFGGGKWDSEYEHSHWEDAA